MRKEPGFHTKREKRAKRRATDEGGTLAPVSQLMALTEETQNRVAELKKTYRDVLPYEVLATPQPEAEPSTPTPPPVQPPVKTLGRLPQEPEPQESDPPESSIRSQRVPPLQSHPQPPRLAQR